MRTAILSLVFGLLCVPAVGQDEVPMVDRKEFQARAAKLAEAQAAWNKMSAAERTYVLDWRAEIKTEADPAKRSALLEKYEERVTPGIIFAVLKFNSERGPKQPKAVICGVLAAEYTVFQIIDEDNMIVETETLWKSEQMLWLSGISTKGIEPDDKLAKKTIVVIAGKKEYKNLRGGTQVVTLAEVVDPSPWLKFKDIWLR